MRQLYWAASAAVISAVIAPCAVQAQTPVRDSANASADAAAGAGDEIIVTARRREETLQGAPIAMSAFGEQTLERVELRSVQDLQQLAPSLNLTGRSPGRPQQYMRGIGTDQFTNAADPAIGVFIDDVYLPRASSVLSALTDVQRIEVLRGPQGTLYGRNTTGGAIRIITNEPSDAFEATGEAVIGSFEDRLLRLTLSGPTGIAGVSARGTLYHRANEGYLVNSATGARGGGDDTQFADVKLLWEIGRNAEVLFGVNHVATDTGGEYSRTIGPRPTLISPFAPNAVIPSDPFAGPANVNSVIDRDSTQAFVRAVIEMGFADLTSITAYRDGSLFETFDQDGSNLDIWTQTSTESTESFTQEFRLNGQSASLVGLGGEVNWIFGAFYLDEASNRLTRTGFGPDSASVFLARRAGLITANRFDATLDFDIATQSVAAFGSLDWGVTEQLTMTLGGRWTRDEKEADFIGFTPAPGVPPGGANFTLRGRSEAWESFDPKIGLDFAVSEDVLLFANWSTGFRSGGFQALPTSADIATRAYAPESLEATQLGLKSSWFDGRLIANITAFDYAYEDLQVQSIRALPGGVLQSFVDNAAAATLRGGELEMRARPVDWFDGGVSYAYLDAKYDEFRNAPMPNLTGSRLPRAPEHQVRTDVNLRFPLSDANDLVLRADSAYFSEQFLALGAGQIPLTTQEGYTVLSGSIGLELGSGRIDLRLFGRNLGDTQYLGAVNFFGGPPAVQYWAPPRTWGLSIRVRN